MRAAAAIVAAMAAVPLAAQSRAAAQYDVVTSVVLPAGDAKAGRQAFADLKCHVCHVVAGERAFPPPAAAVRGPDLDRALRMRSASDLAEAIITPSHSFSVKTSADVRERLRKDARSPMGDFSRVLTVRQLADLLAYLRSLRSP